MIDGESLFRTDEKIIRNNLINNLIIKNIKNEKINKDKEIWLKILPELKQRNLDNIINFIPRKPQEVIGFPTVELVRGDVNGLLEFMQKVPQTAEGSDPLYLLTSGVAIELITGFKRHHQDLDIVTLTDFGNPLLMGVDFVTPQKYWVDMKFDPGYLKDTAYRVSFNDEKGKEHTVLTVHPAILLVQKLTDWAPNPRRPKDIEDAGHLFYYWMQSLSGDPSWIPIINWSIQALPESQRKITSDRLASLLSSTIPSK